MNTKEEKDYLEVNRKSWNNKTEIHVASEFYDNENFLKGRSSLNDIEIELLGDVKGKSILHLQCHFGQDSISMARMGAEVTGVDLSDRSIQKAKELSKSTGVSCDFICCDVYALPNHLDKKYDIVFTSYGTIIWLPDLSQWAGVISHFLKPNGRLVFVDFHPVIWMFDDHFKTIKYRYFNSGPIEEEEEGTYADKGADVHDSCVTWNHSFSEIVNSLIRKGLGIDALHEYDYSPYNCFDELVEIAPSKFRIKHLEDKLPMVYAIEATRV